MTQWMRGIGGYVAAPQRNSEQELVEGICERMTRFRE